MHLDKLIELYEKNVLLYNTQIERATLEYLCRLRTLEGNGKKVNREPKAQVQTIRDYANEVGVNYMSLYLMLKRDDKSPKSISGETTRNNALIHYDRDEFYAWWNNRQKK